MLKFLNSKEKHEIEEKLKERFGIEKVPDYLIMLGKEKIKLFTGNFSADEIETLFKITPIEGIGLYLMKDENGELRLSIEGSQILGKQANKNIFQLTEEQLKTWMEGADLQIKNEDRGVFLMKYKDDLLGSGKKSAEKISNFIPKGRRIKP